MASPKLSACLIARNEAGNIGPCIDTIRRGVDEVVVLDTGSEDGTPEIARAAGARVVEDPSLLIEVDGVRYLSDFAEARNRCLAAAQGDWALIVDADHRYVWPALDAIRATLRTTDSNTLTLWYHNAAKRDAMPAHVVSGKARVGKPYGALAVIRRSLPGPWYRGVIHETVSEWEEAHGAPRSVVERSRVADYSHIPDVRREKAKDRRNIVLLERAVALNPTDPVNLTYLAQEYSQVQDPKAFRTVDAAWSMLGHSRLIGAHFLRLTVVRAFLALSQNRPEVAWDTCNEWDARDGAPHPDVLTMRGLAAEKLGLLNEAKAYFRAALTGSGEWVVRFIQSDTARERLRALE